MSERCSGPLFQHLYCTAVCASAQTKSGQRMSAFPDPKGFQNPSGLGLTTAYLVFRYSRIISAAVAPSPTALAACLVLPSRTSPAAKTPGRLVSNMLFVVTNPYWSRLISGGSQPLLGDRPMKTKAPAGAIFSVAPVLRFRIVMLLNLPFSAPCSSATSVS